MAREKKTPRKKSPMSVAIAALRGLFDADEIPKGFTHKGQTFEDRSEAWLLHAVEQIEEEIEEFKDEE
jgi:hypothetical protein